MVYCTCKVLPADRYPEVPETIARDKTLAEGTVNAPKKAITEFMAQLPGLSGYRCIMKLGITLMQANDKKAAKKASDEAAVLEAIAAMPEPYRAMGEQLHAIITANAPALSPKTWYGMPAYARDDKVVCFFRGGDKFKERYMTLGFNDAAKLDEGCLWPIVFALTAVTDAETEKIRAIVKKAVS